MSPFKLSLITAALTVAVTAGGLAYAQRQRVREFYTLQNENNRLRLQLSQRREAARSAGSPTTPPAIASQPDIAPAKATGTVLPPRPAEYYRDEGNATPLATLQTFAWACDRGDVETVSRLLFIDAKARPKAEAFWAALPPEKRAEWATLDDMAAVLLTHSFMASPFPASDVLATATVEAISDDRVRLRMPDVPKDGTEYQRTATGWRYVLTERMVDDYIQRNRPQ